MRRRGGSDSSSTAYSEPVAVAASATGIPPALLNALVMHESSGNPNAVSQSGAQGLTQLMPGTAKELGVTNPFDPMQNALGGARYLRQLLDRYNGNLIAALSAYNQGPGGFDQKGVLAEQVPYIAGIVSQFMGNQ